MPTGTTTLNKLIDPEVMAPMISGKINSAIVVTPIAKIDTTLEGKPGSTITVPKYQYIGDAEDLAEGVTADKTQLTTTSAEYQIKKAVKQVELTDEAVLSGYGNPVGETNSQLAKAIAAKVDEDAMTALKGAQLQKTFGAGVGISYNNIVDTIDVLNEEENVEKVMFIHPKQVSELRKDSNFISNDKYPNNVIMKGEIGMIANTRIVPSKKAVNAEKTYFMNPIVELKPQSQTGDETAALTIFLKRDTNVETQRELGNYTTLIGADKHYVVALTDESKVVVAKFEVGNVSL